MSRRLEETIVTAPIVFAAAGMLVGSVTPAVLGPAFGRDAFLRLAEVGLVLLLFTDASRTDLNVLRNIRSLPTRLLSAGMLLTIVLGAVAALIVFPHLSIWEAGILAAILAPTDAGLGQVIVNSPRVPMRIRQALNVEAGLNDGLSVPFLLFFIALATAGGEGGTASLMRFILDQLGLGVLVGVAIGLAGGWLLAHADRKEWMAELVPTGRRGCAAGAMPAGVRNGGREHVHCRVRRRPGGADRLQGRERAQPRVRGRMGTSVESFRVLPLRPVWWRNNGSRSTRRRCCTRCSA